jgi:hypothetical protein
VKKPFSYSPREKKERGERLVLLLLLFLDFFFFFFKRDKLKKDEGSGGRSLIDNLIDDPCSMGVVAAVCF